MTVQRSTVASLLRSSQAYCQQVCDKETLTHGIAFYSERFAHLPAANQFREVTVAAASEIPRAFDDVQRWFQSQGTQCARWAPADPTAVEPFASFLDPHGFTARHYTAMTLTRWSDSDAHSGLRILPARAMRAAYRESFETLTSGTPDVANADLYEARLDDPSYDAFLALIDNVPVARGALYQLGDFARVIDFARLSTIAGDEAPAALLGHLLALARRLSMRSVHTQIAAENHPARALLESAGFVTDGELVEFHLGTIPDPGDVR